MLEAYHCLMAIVNLTTASVVLVVHTVALAALRRFLGLYSRTSPGQHGLALRSASLAGTHAFRWPPNKPFEK